MTDQEKAERLEKLTTRELLDYLKQCRKFNGSYSPWDYGDGYTMAQIKAVLATREHIPNKAESRKKRQDQAWGKKHR